MNIMLIINIVAIGIANIMNAQLAASRLLYSMGRDAVIPRIFGKVHPKYQTPWVGAIFRHAPDAQYTRRAPDACRGLWGTGEGVRLGAYTSRFLKGPPW